MEFDPFAARYSEAVEKSLPAFAESTSYYAQMKTRLLTAHVESVLGSSKALQCLDVGCGTGMMCQFLQLSFASLRGCDPSSAMLSEARKTSPDTPFDACEEGQALPYDDATFDVVTTACTLHHIAPGLRSAFATELLRVTRPGGMVFVFEHNPSNPVTRAVVRGCEFDKDAILLSSTETRGLLAAAGLHSIRTIFYLFFPRMVRFLAPLERFMTWLPVGGQYYVVGRRPAS